MPICLPVPATTHPPPPPVRSQASHGVRVLEGVAGGRAAAAGPAGGRLRRAPLEVRARRLGLQRARHPAAQAAPLPQGSSPPFSRWLLASLLPPLPPSLFCPAPSVRPTPRLASRMRHAAAAIHWTEAPRCCFAANFLVTMETQLPTAILTIRFASEAIRLTTSSSEFPFPNQ